MGYVPYISLWCPCGPALDRSKNWKRSYRENRGSPRVFHAAVVKNSFSLSRVSTVDKAEDRIGINHEHGWLG
jgi:hypothetical protein